VRKKKNPATKPGGPAVLEKKKPHAAGKVPPKPQRREKGPTSVQNGLGKKPLKTEKSISETADPKTAGKGEPTKGQKTKP